MDSASRSLQKKIPTYFLPIIGGLEAIVNCSATKWNRDSQSDAQSLLLALSQFFFFIVALEATHSALAYIIGLSGKLQGAYVDVAYAYHEVKSVNSILHGSRSNAYSFHSQIYTRDLKMAGSVGVVWRSRDHVQLVDSNIIKISRHKIVVITSV